MPAWIGFFVLGVNVLLTLRKPKAGVWLYLVLIFIFPHTQIAGRAVGYDILGFIPLFLSVIFVRKGFLKRPNYLYLLVPFYPSLMLLSTWISLILYSFPVNILPFLGVVRFCIVLLIVIECLDVKDIFSAITLVIFVNLVISSVQLYFPYESIGVFYNLYGQQSHQVLDRFFEIGRFIRPTGTLLSPVDIGILVIIYYSMCISYFYKTDEYISSIFCFSIAIMTGVISLTKTAFLGIPIITVSFLFLIIIITFSNGIGGITLRYKGIILYSFVSLFVLSISYYLYGFLVGEFGYRFEYYVSFIFRPLEAFESRYSEYGELGQTIDIILKYPLIGLGTTLAKGEFLGDSTLVKVAHDTGLVGLTLHFSIYFYVLYHIIKERYYVLLLVLFSLFLSGLALSIFYTKYGVIALAYCIIPPLSD